jgi:hypothetical protein
MVVDGRLTEPEPTFRATAGSSADRRCPRLELEPETQADATAIFVAAAERDQPSAQGAAAGQPPPCPKHPPLPPDPVVSKVPAEMVPPLGPPPANSAVSPALAAPGTPAAQPPTAQLELGQSLSQTWFAVPGSRDLPHSTRPSRWRRNSDGVSGIGLWSRLGTLEEEPVPQPVSRAQLPHAPEPDVPSRTESWQATPPLSQPEQPSGQQEEPWQASALQTQPRQAPPGQPVLASPGTSAAAFSRARHSAHGGASASTAAEAARSTPFL